MSYMLYAPLKEGEKNVSNDGNLEGVTNIKEITYIREKF